LSAVDLGSLLVEECRFVDNIAVEQASALLSARSGATIRNNLFLRNASAGLTSAGAMDIGGFSQGFVLIEGNTFLLCSTDSYPTGVGSAIFLNAGAFPIFQVKNNIFSDCTGSPAVYVWSGTVEHSCNVFWENSDGEMSIPLDPTDRVVNPQFCNPLLDDLTLNATSPCLPENSMGCGLIGAFGQGCGIVSLEEMSWGRIKNLYRSDER